MEEKNAGKAVGGQMADSKTNAVDIVSGIVTASNLQTDFMDKDKGTWYKDRCLNDGFKVSFTDNKMVITYSKDVPRQSIRDNKKHESELNDMVNQAVSWIKKNFKEITGKSVTLTKDSDPLLRYDQYSNQREFVRMTTVYKIGKVESNFDTENDYRKSLEKFR